MQYHALEDGRYVLRLDPGEEVMTSLRHFAAEEKVVAGLIMGLGSTSHVTLGFLDPETNEYVKRKFDEHMEVGNLTGTVSVAADDGRPFVHLHGVFGPRELIAYTGHVHEARVGAVMEIFINTYTERLERLSVPDKPFPWLFLPGEPRPEGGDAGQ